MEDRRDGWMDRGKEEWRAGGLLCFSNNGHSKNVYIEKKILENRRKRIKMMQRGDLQLRGFWIHPTSCYCPSHTCDID